MIKHQLAYHEVQCLDGGGWNWETVAKFSTYAAAKQVADKLHKEKKWLYRAWKEVTKENLVIYDSIEEFFDKKKSL